MKGLLIVLSSVLLSGCSLVAENMTPYDVASVPQAILYGATMISLAILFK